MYIIGKDVTYTKASESRIGNEYTPTLLSYIDITSKLFNKILWE